MAEFIHFEATDENENDVEMSESNDKNSSMESFINDDSSIENTEIEQYFHNLQVDMKEANERIQKEALERIQDFDDYSNLSYVSDEDELSSVHDFSKSTDQIEKFKKNLLPIGQNESKYDFVKIISYKVRQILEGKTDECLDESLKENPIIESLFEDLNEKFIFSLDIQKFELVCYEINQILIKHDFFLRVVEQKNKYRNILIKTPEKQNQIKELASCLSQKYNGFQVVKNAFSKLQRRDFQPIDIIYIPTKNIQILPVCYYTVDISNAYTALYSEGEKIRRALTLYECYYCNKFFRRKGKAEIHLKVCSGKPGIVYNFCSQTLTSFEDNFKSKGDVPFTIYFDFETTSPTDADWLNPEDKKMFVVSYIIVVAFHPYFNYEKILVQRSVSQPKKELISINYLSREQFAFKTPEIIKQLYDQAILVSKRTCKNALGVMFGIELSFIKRTLLNWFNKKVSAPYKKLDQTQITKYEQENPISWGKKPKCVICKMPLNSVFSSVKKPDSEMYYADYIVRYEYKFLKNTLTKEQLESSKDLKTLESYYTAFESFIHHSIEIYRLLNNFNLRLKDISTEVKEFLENKFDDEAHDIAFIKNEIMLTDVKNAIKECGNSIPKIRLKIYAFLYNELIQFPLGIDYDSITSKNFFQHVHNQITHKVHLHHSHITGQIIGYSHCFCNKRIVELEKPEIPCIAHNLFGFDFWFFMKGFSTTSWCSAQLTAGGTNLTNLNFGNLKSELKFIDSLKYYQRSLAELTSSMDLKEIESAKENMTLFLKNPYYFSTIWPFLPATKQTEILKITCEGKGVIPYELVTNLDSFFQTPEKDFWLKTDFYSELKQKHISDEEYELSKFLYQTLKIRNLGDLNDLYNAQDVILLCELIENRFQFMQDKYGFNPRKCNSASSLSGCIEREMSRVIISFPTNVEHLEIFEKTITGGFSCVNTRLAFDTLILLPKKSDGSKDLNFKCIYNINDEKKRVISKILKLDENNQYGHAMTKPLPTGCIKNDPDLSWNTFNLLLESVNLNDQIGHL